MITRKVDGHQDRLELQMEHMRVRLPFPNIIQCTVSNIIFTLLMSSSSTGFLGFSTGFSSTGEAASKGCRTLVQNWSDLKLHQHQFKKLFKSCNTVDLSIEQLTLKMRKTFLAAATEVWTFFASPASPAETNMAAYCSTREDLLRADSFEVTGSANTSILESHRNHLYSCSQLVTPI